MEKILLPNKTEILINDSIQIGTKGDRFKLLGITKNIEQTPLWVNKTERWHWIYEFRYLDKSGGFNIEIDYFDNFISLSKII